MQTKDERNLNRVVKWHKRMLVLTTVLSVLFAPLFAVITVFRSTPTWLQILTFTLLLVDGVSIVITIKLGDKLRPLSH